MADSPDGKPTDGTPAAPQLPVVWSPQLDAAEATSEDFPRSDAEDAMSFSAGEGASGETDQPKSAPIGDASPLRSLRLAMLAASIATAAAVGSFAGSFAASGVSHLWPAGAASANMPAVNSPQATKAELADLSALKANLAAAARTASSQFATLADRLDHIERAQIEPTSKLARIADAIERIERKNVMASAVGPAPAAPAAPETTGTIASAPPAAAADARLPDKILPDWNVQDVRGGHALIVSRYGAIFDVAAGSVLPGLGRVEAIKRQDGKWVIVTAHGVIAER